VIRLMLLLVNSPATKLKLLHGCYREAQALSLNQQDELIEDYRQATMGEVCTKPVQRSEHGPGHAGRSPFVISTLGVIALTLLQQDAA
jgi:hypothetical protein